MLVPGFEPGSKEWESFMMGHYTIRAWQTSLRIACIYASRFFFLAVFSSLKLNWKWNMLCMMRLHFHFNFRVWIRSWYTTGNKSRLWTNKSKTQDFQICANPGKKVTNPYGHRKYEHTSLVPQVNCPGTRRTWHGKPLPALDLYQQVQFVRQHCNC